MLVLSRVSSVALALLVMAAPVRQERKITRTPGQLAALRAPGSAAGSWPSFRGRNADGVADGQHLPDQWDVETGENILWRAPIPGLAHSSPIVWGTRIYLTTAISSRSDAKFVTGMFGAGTQSDDATSQRWVVYCLDKSSGKVIWERVAHEGAPIEKRHVKSTYASATPATDGRIVVAWFGSQGVYAYNMDGTLRWKVDLGHLDVGAYDAQTLEWGTASSPIIWNDLVILQADTHQDDFVLALDAATGQVRWKTDRNELPSWGTPTVVTTPSGPQLVTNGSNFVRAYDPRTGRELWRLGKSSQITVPTPIFADGLIVVSSGRGPERPIFVVHPTATGDITLRNGETSSPAVAWSRTGRGPYMPTPVIYDHVLYVLNNTGVVHAYTLATGDQIYEARVPQLGSGFLASPVAADGRIYVSGEDGDLMVIAAGPAFRPIATNAMGAPVMATPALSEGVMYVRTSMGLVAIGHAPKPSSDAERARRGLVDTRPGNFVPWTEVAPSGTSATLTITIAANRPEQAKLAGTWKADVPGVQNPMEIRIRLDGGVLSGELQNGPNTLKLIEGTATATGIAFKVVAPTGDRTVAFVGTLKGDELAFTRTVRVHEGGKPGGAGLFGMLGAPAFAATRVPK